MDLFRALAFISITAYFIQEMVYKKESHDRELNHLKRNDQEWVEFYKFKQSLEKPAPLKKAKK